MAALPRPFVPSGGRGARRRVRMLAVLAVRDEMRFLPGFVRNVGPQVDGIVALDDGSTDGSADYLAARPEVIELIRVPPERPDWDEPGNYRRLIEAALRQGAEWILALDADERLEREFRERAERVIRRGALLGRRAFEVRLRELWDTPEQYRADGIWGRKRYGRLFAARADHEFDSAPLHAHKCPVQERRNGVYTLADLELYHLRMIDPADRASRRRRYELADPDARHQPDHGYAYLTDERGLRLRRVRRGRGWVE